MMEMPRNSAVNVRSCSYNSTPHRKELRGKTVMLAHSFKRQSPSRHGAEGAWSHDIHSHEVEDEQEVGGRLCYLRTCLGDSSSIQQCHTS